MTRSIAESTHLIDLIGVSKTYGEDTQALTPIDLYIRKNEFITLLGPSGCGKTTLLRLIAGFEAPSTGKVYFGGKDITDVPPYKRHVNTVFQKYALFPHLNVFDNIAFGLNIKKASKKEIQETVHSMLEMVGLKGFEKRNIDALSGGQQQRVAIARALAVKPQVLLLDEPLGALDLKLRKEMQFELKNMQQRVGITFIYVTHDQEEALTMSDTIVVMKDGRIQQVGTPTSIYNEPKNAFVADFIGESNILDGVMLRDRLVRFGDVDFVCVDEGFGENMPVEVVIRPEDIRFLSPEEGQLSGEVLSVLFKGVHYETRVHTDNPDMDWTIHSTTAPEEGSRIGLRVTPDDIHIMKKVIQ